MREFWSAIAILAIASGGEGCSGGGDAASATAPEFTSQSNVALPENTTSVVTISATASGGVAYAIAGGPDAAAFRIDPATGSLNAITPFDFENPTDANRDNVYEILVSATASGARSTQTVRVTVSDANDAGIVRIRGARNGDFIGFDISDLGELQTDGGAGELGLAMHKTVWSPSPDIGYIVFGEALRSLSQQARPGSGATLNLGALQARQGIALRTNLPIQADPSTVIATPPIAAGLDASTSPVRRHAVVGHLSSVSVVSAAPAAAFDLLGGALNFDNAPLPANVRRVYPANAASPLDFIGAGDVSGDRTTDYLRAAENATAVISGRSPAFLAGTLASPLAPQPGSIVFVSPDVLPTLTSVGDVDGDGRDDLAAAVDNLVGEASIFVLSGRRVFEDADGVVRRAELTADDLVEIRFPWPWAFPSPSFDSGDVTGDGLGDIVFNVFGPEGATTAYIVSGAAIRDEADGLITVAELPLRAIALRNAGAPQSSPTVAIIPSIDGDAVADLLVQHATASNGVLDVVPGRFLQGRQNFDIGAAQLPAGVARILSLTAAEANNQTGALGFSASAVTRDLDNDRADDLLLGASSEDGGANALNARGAVYVIPSSRLRAAAGSGAPIRLSDEF